MLIRIEPDLPRLPSLDLAQTLGILRVYTFTSLHYKICKICGKIKGDVSTANKLNNQIYQS